MFCKIIVWNRKIFMRVFQHWGKLESDRHAESTEIIYLISVIREFLNSCWIILSFFRFDQRRCRPGNDPVDGRKHKSCRFNLGKRNEMG